MSEKDNIINPIDKASPRPWKVVYDDDPGGGHNQIVDADGKDVVSFYDCEGWLTREDAVLIVEAVNEYDGKHTFCTQSCVWMGAEIERLRKENERLQTTIGGIEHIVKQQKQTIKEMEATK